MHIRLFRKSWVVLPLLVSANLGGVWAADTGTPAPSEPVTAPPPPLDIHLEGTPPPPEAGAEGPTVDVKASAEGDFKSVDAGKNLETPAPLPPAAPEAAPKAPPAPTQAEHATEPKPPAVAADTGVPAPAASPTPDQMLQQEKQKTQAEAEAPVLPLPAPPPEPASPPELTRDNVITSAPRVAARPDRDLWFHKMRPQWGVELLGSTGALGGNDLVSGQTGNKTQAVGLQIEFQPKFIQSIGVLGIGPSFLVYPISADAGVTSGPMSLWSVGAQVRYQARFFREQFLVPMAGFEFQYLKYGFTTGAAGNLSVNGPFYGLWVLLNVFEPTAAAESYIDNGIARSYLVAEIHQLKGSNADLNISNGSFFFGLRFEY